MNSQYQIKIKFCGGCNPEIDRGNLVRRFNELLESSTFKNKINFSNGNDILILINGCPHACLDEDRTLIESFSTSISVHGKMIEFISASEDKLPEILLEKIENIIK